MSKYNTYNDRPNPAVVLWGIIALLIIIGWLHKATTDESTVENPTPIVEK